MKPERGNPPWWFSTSFWMWKPRGKYEFPWNSMRNSQNHHKITFPHVFPHVFSTSMSYLCWLVVWNIWIIFPYIGNFIIPTDFYIFQRGRYTTNQMSLSHNTCLRTVSPYEVPGLSMTPMIYVISMSLCKRLPQSLQVPFLDHLSVLTTRWGPCSCQNCCRVPRSARGYRLDGQWPRG